MACAGPFHTVGEELFRELRGATLQKQGSEHRCQPMRDATQQRCLTFWGMVRGGEEGSESSFLGSDSHVNVDLRFTPTTASVGPISHDCPWPLQQQQKLYSDHSYNRIYVLEAYLACASHCCKYFYKHFYYIL